MSGNVGGWLNLATMRDVATPAPQTGADVPNQKQARVRNRAVMNAYRHLDKEPHRTNPYSYFGTLGFRGIALGLMFDHLAGG